MPVEVKNTIGRMMTGRNVYMEAYRERFLAQTMTGKLGNALVRVFPQHAQIIEKVSREFPLFWREKIDPMKTLEVATKFEIGPEEGEKYTIEFAGRLYQAMGNLSVRTEELKDLWLRSQKAIDKGLIEPVQLFRFLEQNPKDENERRFFNEIISNKDHPLHFLNRYREIGEEIGGAAASLGLAQTGQIMEYYGKYFPYISLLSIANNERPENLHAVMASIGGLKMTLNRFKERYKNEIDPKIIEKYPHHAFTIAMLEEHFDVLTKKFMKHLIATEMAFGFPNIAPHSFVEMPDGELVPINQARKTRDVLNQLYRNLKDVNLKDLLKDNETLTSEEREQYMKELTEFKKKVKSDIEFINKQISIYDKILDWIALRPEERTKESFKEIFALEKKTPKGEKVKEYLAPEDRIEAWYDYYNRNADRFVLLDVGKEKVSYRTRLKLGVIPNVMGYDIMAGMLVSKELYPEINMYFEFASPDAGMRFLRGFHNLATKLTNIHKYLNVALNPPSYVKNVVGNFMFYYLYGVPIHKIPEYYLKGLLILSDPQNAELLERFGIGFGSFSREIVNNLKRALEQDIKITEKFGEKVDLFSVAHNFMQTFYKITTKLGGGYDLIDKIARAGLIAYMNDYNVFGEKIFDLEAGFRIKNVNEDLMRKAMVDAYRFTIDYGSVSVLLRKIRTGMLGFVSGLTPYITFVAKAPFVFGEAMRRNPIRAWSLLALPIGMYLASYLSMLGDDGGEEVWRLSIDAYKNFKTIVLPFRTKEGKFVFVSLAGWHPLDNYYDFAMNLAKGEFGRALIESGFVLSNPISQIGITLLTGKDPFTEKEYFTDLDRMIPSRYFGKLLVLLTDAYAMSYFKSYGFASAWVKGMEDELVLPKLIGINVRQRSLEELAMYNRAKFLRAKIDLGKLRGEIQRKFNREEIGFSEYLQQMEELDRLKMELILKEQEFWDEVFQNEEAEGEEE
jgi:hypothetical protein